jgi:hypothetical protein
MAFVTIELLNSCVDTTLANLQVDPQAYAAALAAAGSEQALAHQIVDQCLKALGTTVTADALTACSTGELTALQADPQAYADQLALVGGDPKQLYAAIIAACLERLQTGGGTAIPNLPASKAAEKKTPWGWIIGGTLAVAAIGTAIYVAGADDKKKK